MSIRFTLRNAADTSADGSASRLWRVPLLPRLLSAFATFALAGVTVFLGGMAVLVLPHQWALALFVMAPTACFVAGLTGYVWRDFAGKWGLAVTLAVDRVTLDLPRGRSLIHRPRAEHVTIPYVDIEAIETRLEAYRTLGMAMMQRAYVLRRKNGEAIFLFEDRALATPLSVPISAQMAEDLAKRAAVPLRDIGMVEGRGGVLGVWGTHAADWATPSLPLARQLWLWRHAAITGSLAIVIIIIAFAVRLIVAAS